MCSPTWTEDIILYGGLLPLEACLASKLGAFHSFQLHSGRVCPSLVSTSGNRDAILDEVYCDTSTDALVELTQDRVPKAGEARSIRCDVDHSERYTPIKRTGENTWAES